MVPAHRVDRLAGEDPRVAGFLDPGDTGIATVFGEAADGDDSSVSSRRIMATVLVGVRLVQRINSDVIIRRDPVWRPDLSLLRPRCIELSWRYRTLRRPQVSVRERGKR